MVVNLLEEKVEYGTALIKLTTVAKGSTDLVTSRAWLALNKVNRHQGNAAKAGANFNLNNDHFRGTTLAKIVCQNAVDNQRSRPDFSKDID